MKLLSLLKLQLALIGSSLFWASVSGQATNATATATPTCAFGSCDECLTQGCSWVNSTCAASCNIFTNIFRQGFECLTFVESDPVSVGELCLRASASEGSTSVTDDSGSDGIQVDDDQDTCGVLNNSTCEACLESNCILSDGLCSSGCSMDATYCLSTASFPSNSTSFDICSCIPQDNVTASEFCASGLGEFVSSPLDSLLLGNVTGNATGNFTFNETTMAPSPTPNPSELISVDDESVAPVSPLGLACESTEDCGDGDFFCSSSTSTCLDLNCTNWLEGTPEGKLPFGEEPCISKVDGIESQAQFCSPYDGQCHDYSCDEWYKYGPVAYTGYDPFKPVELTCEDYADGAKDSRNSIVFGCRPYTPGNKAPEARTWTFYFNQRCTALPRSGHEFTCYNNKDDTDYRDYLGEVARINPPFCDPATYGGITSQSNFWYNTIMAQNRSGEATFHKDGRENTTSTSQFDPSEADRTMFSYVFSDQPVPEQTMLGGTPPSSSATPSAPFLAGSLLLSGLGALVASLCM